MTVWGPWTSTGMKLEQTVQTKTEPVEADGEYDGDAQPRHWQDWQSPSGTVHTANSSAESDGGTGSDTWWNRSWDWSWQAWQDSQSWPPRGSYDWEEGGNENAELMDETEKALAARVNSILGPPGSDSTADRLAQAKLNMGKRDVTKANNITEALAFIESGTLGKHHNAVQAARRDPTFKGDDATTANKAYVKSFFEAQLEKLVCQYLHT